ncbi:prefoldin subunit beta [Candidatus Woesearchaeota archaeon]|nr:prefoldin subunit beta [Candidatus Woesearchaeota archaeon]MBW3016770.1 prefoldin subunit beta [Candidatus Woesearchaeota archaeon]
MSNHAQENIAMLQNIEQSLQAIVLQKQTFQSQLIEVESAIKELEGKDSAYKIVGNIMVMTKKDDIMKELEEKKEKISLRIKSLESQESKLKEKSESMQKEVMDKLKKKE